MWRQCKQLSLLKIYKFIQQKTASGLPGCGVKKKKKKYFQKLVTKEAHKSLQKQNMNQISTSNIR